MKSFLSNILKFLSIVLFLFLFSNLINYKYVKSKSWNIPDSVNVLFMGASQIELGIDPQYYPGSINLAKGSERYLYTYLKLKEIVSSRSQIDTLFLHFIPTDVWTGTDTKYFLEGEINEFVPMFYPYFSSDEWSVFLHEPIKVLSRYHSFICRPRHYGFGGHGIVDRKYNSANRNLAPIDCEYNENVINHQYLDKIVELCNENSIKLIFIYMPVCHAEDYYDINAYYKFYNDNYSNIRLLDYSNWECVDSLRADEHHLNHNGATVFTKMLYETIDK